VLSNSPKATEVSQARSLAMDSIVNQITAHTLALDDTKLTVES